MTLSAYLLTAMLAWAPGEHRGDASATAMVARYQSIADDVANISLEPTEPPLYAGDNGRARTALILLELAWWESGFLRRVDVGKCLRDECDYGAAFSLWQLQPKNGITFEGTGFLYASMRSADWIATHPGEVYTGEDLVKNRALAVRVALHMARAGLGNWSTAKWAVPHARKWWSEHPYGGE